MNYAPVPPDLVASIEQQCGGRIIGITPRGGGGASRQGAEIMLRTGRGEELKGYLSYDSRKADPWRKPFFARETAILRALSGPLSGSGVRAPRLLAADTNHLALLTTLEPGCDKMGELDRAEQEAVCLDCIAQLAALHRIDCRSLSLEGFGESQKSVSERISEQVSALRAANLATAPEPLLLLALDWLEAHVPADHGPAVIVHGDAGPGNFLHADGKVTALLDWELCHFGDPMEDLAGIWVRNLFQPFLPPHRVFDAYEAAGGVAVDADRVRYFRLYFQLGFTVPGYNNLFGPTDIRWAAAGATLMYQTVHMRVIAQSLAELSGIALSPVALPEAAVGWRDRIYAQALDDLRESIVPSLQDQGAAAKGKALARLVKFWRARDRFGALFDETEIAETVAVLGRPLRSTDEARRALADAIVNKAIGFEPALRLCHARVMRDTFVMAGALGALKDVYFAPLTNR